MQQKHLFETNLYTVQAYVAKNNLNPYIILKGIRGPCFAYDLFIYLFVVYLKTLYQ
jgi:hypothetical protein